MKIFNTLTRYKEEFVPIEPGKVRMYVCGPTVYNFIHIGNARPMIFFDTVRRYFEYKGYEVNFVSNFTDVDDKIIKAAAEEGVDSSEISERYRTKENKYKVELDRDEVLAQGAKIIADDVIRIEKGTLVHDEIKTAYMVFSSLM